MNEPPTTTALATTTTDIELTASTPVEMHAAQARLIDWCEWKIKAVAAEAKELWENFKIAQRNKWRTSTLERHAKLADKRKEFYSKIKAALEAGFYIVPEFPVTVFAIRTDAKAPKRYATFSRYSNHQQQAKVLPQGEGEYQSSQPEVWELSGIKMQEHGKEVEKTQYYAKAFQAVDFPVNMAKPQIMEAAERAMALKIFDDLGVLPSARRPADPVIIGRIIDPRLPLLRFRQRHVAFLISWHLNTDTL